MRTFNLEEILKKFACCIIKVGLYQVVNKTICFMKLKSITAENMTRELDPTCMQLAAAAREQHFQNGRHG